MKIILSRKGYDSQYGVYPSIITPEGSMLSFPIPVPDEVGIVSSKLSFKGKCLKTLFSELGHKDKEVNHHVDPDLGMYQVNGMPSPSAGVFGQSMAAAGHLENQAIGKGDVFLFFGTFQRTVGQSGALNYDKRELPFHAIFGYLEIGEVIRDIEGIPNRPDKGRLMEHPHYTNRGHKLYLNNNRMYLSDNYGFFKYNDILKLTKSGSDKKSLWSLPGCFQDLKISYHGKRGRLDDEQFILQSVGRGQEFVFEVKASVEGWLEEILNCRPDISL